MASEDKSEKATPYRLREARKRGDIPTSPEITGAVIAVVSLLALQQEGAHLVGGLLNLLAQDIAFTANPRLLTEATVSAHIHSDVASGLLLLLPIAVATVVAILVAGALNTRGLLSLHSIKPSFRKLNPLKGIQHLFGKEALILLLKVILKLVMALAILWAWQVSWQALLPNLAYMSEGSAASLLWDDTLHVALQITGAFFAIGALDFGYRQYAWRKRQRMTKQDVKDESRRMEGNPQIRARIRQIGRRRLRALLNGTGLRAVPRADVVITNPTHFAVAVQYKAGKMRAPKVIAKGQRLVALRIKDAARQHNIPVVENKPLAQALFKSVEVNQEIPADLYQAVAQVLAFVFRMRGGRRTPRRTAASVAARAPR